MALAEKAAAEGARLVAFPEAFVPGYPDWGVADPASGTPTPPPLYARLFDQAVVVGFPGHRPARDDGGQSFGIWLSVGVDERDDGTPPSITPCCHVVAPDGDGCAALGFWLTKLYGHQDARILDCSRDAWRDRRGTPVSSQPSEPAAAG